MSDQMLGKEVALKCSEVEDNPALEKCANQLTDNYNRLQQVYARIEQLTHNQMSNDLQIDLEDREHQDFESYLQQCRQLISRLEERQNPDRYQNIAEEFKKQLQEFIGRCGQIHRDQIDRKYASKIMQLKKSEVKSKTSEVEMEVSKSSSQFHRQKAHNHAFNSLNQPEDSLKTPLTSKDGSQQQLKFQEGNDVKWKSEYADNSISSDRFQQEQEKVLMNQKEEQLKLCNEYVKKLNDIMNDLGSNQIAPNVADEIIQEVIKKEEIAVQQSVIERDDPKVIRVRRIAQAIAVVSILGMAVPVCLYVF